MKEGGISRFEKLEYFFSTIIGQKEYEDDLKKLLQTFSLILEKKLLACLETEGVKELIQALSPDSKKIIVSGGLQTKLRKIFKDKGLTSNLDGIFGCPDNKIKILKRELKTGLIKPPIIFIGDSKYDYESAKSIGADFVFMSEYTEFLDWQNYFKNKKVKIIKNLRELI